MAGADMANLRNSRQKMTVHVHPDEMTGKEIYGISCSTPSAPAESDITLHTVTSSLDHDFSRICTGPAQETTAARLRERSSSVRNRNRCPPEGAFILRAKQESLPA
jgi:uncharacterized protein